jgi:hypothetical protein
MPSWLMSILFALLFIGIGVSVYWVVGYLRTREAAPAAPLALEQPGPAPPADAKVNPLRRFVEVTGFRLAQSARKTTDVRFLVVNHSSADIADLAGTVTLRAKGGTSPVGSLSFRLPSLGAYESKEVSAPVQTSLRIYEMPDWQNLEAELQITSPQ